MLQVFQNFLKSEKIYSPGDIAEVIKQVRPNFRFAYNNTKTKYFNVPCSFDIETTSFFRSTGKDDTEKVGIMYEWTFGIYGLVIIGRTWEEFTTLIETLIEILDLKENKRLIIYVHNLSYEFQFMRKYFPWKKVFSLESRKPIYALTISGVEFRCSYLLSGYSLEKLGDELQSYSVKKLVGALDYEKIRHAKTPLTDEETQYCINDVKVVMAYIAERIEQDGDIAKIPLTKTGYVRNYCRQSCFYEEGKSRKKTFKRARYQEIMRGLRLTPEEYAELKRAFQGGFTHANPFYSGRVMENVTSFDFTSSYPAVMLSEKFPMSTGELVAIESREDFYNNLELYCCLFDIEFVNLQSKLLYESYISESRCRNKVKAQTNNGRVVSAERLTTTITEQDFLIISQFYEWDEFRVMNFRRYKKDYLPTDFVKAILKLYHDKTTLKDVDGKEIEYLNSKEMINSCYGMTVTDIVRDEIPYTSEWGTPVPADIEKSIAKYNRNSGRFLFYPWGVWVTAYARRNLFSGIIEFAEDYIYSDTDSVKVLNAEKHQAYIDDYNKTIRQQLYTAMEYHGVSRETIEPKTKDGEKKCLGVWDFDGHYKRFKTLGAKRYMVEYSDDKRNKAKTRGKVQITVAGLNKQKCVPFLCSGWYYDLQHNEYNSPFNKFAEDMYIPPNFTGKMTHTYIDEKRAGIVFDYFGNPCEYSEETAVHLEKADYSLSIAREYAEYLRDIQTIYY